LPDIGSLRPIRSAQIQEMQPTMFSAGYLRARPTAATTLAAAPASGFTNTSEHFKNGADFGSIMAPQLSHAAVLYLLIYRRARSFLREALWAACASE